MVPKGLTTKLCILGSNLGFPSRWGALFWTLPKENINTRAVSKVK